MIFYLNAAIEVLFIFMHVSVVQCTFYNWVTVSSVFINVNRHFTSNFKLCVKKGDSRPPSIDLALIIPFKTNFNV